MKTLRYYFDSALVTEKTLRCITESLIAIPHLTQKHCEFVKTVGMPHESKIYDTLFSYKLGGVLSDTLNEVLSFQRVNLPNDADIIVYPKKYNANDKYNTNPYSDLNFVSGYATKYPSKPIIVFCNDDDSDSIFQELKSKYQNVYFVHTSCYSNSFYSDKAVLKNEQSMPCFVDFQQGIKQPFEFHPRPKIGFCGSRHTSVERNWILTTLTEYKTRNMNRYNELFDINIVGRNSFWNGATIAKTKLSSYCTEKEKQDLKDQIFQTRKEFEDNIFESLFGLVVRGAGNFSYRFWEVMAAGRIPILIDTKTVLPFEDTHPEFYKGVIRIPYLQVNNKSASEGSNCLDNSFFPIITDWYISNMNKLVDLQNYNRRISRLFSPEIYLRNIMYYIYSGHVEGKPILPHTK